MNYEAVIRVGFFIGILIVMSMWELRSPRRTLVNPKRLRWTGNLGLATISIITVRLLLPILAINVALMADDKGWGLFNNIALSEWLLVILSIIALDLIIYLQHVMFHSVPMFWNVHLVHHADLDFDVTTGLRFHPVEITLSMIIKMASVAALGAPPIAVLIFEIILNGTSMFNHGNIKMPLNIDRVLRRFVVTPDMHRVHHSVIRKETNSNFGFNFPWWDRLLGTYRDQPEAGHDGMTIGLSQYRDPKCLTLSWMLSSPFVADPGKYSIKH